MTGHTGALASSARTTTPRRADGRELGAARTEHRGFPALSRLDRAERFSRTEAEVEVTAAIASCLCGWLGFSGLLDPGGGGGVAL